MFHNSQRGYGLKDLFRNITRPLKPIMKPILKEAKGIGKAVGTELAQNFVNDLIAGKSAKDSVKARGKEAKGLAAQHTLKALLRRQQSGNGSFTGEQPPTESNLGTSNKTAKRKRAPSKNKAPAKRKRPQSKSQSAKRTKVQGGGYWNVDRHADWVVDQIVKQSGGRRAKKQTKQTGGLGVGMFLRELGRITGTRRRTQKIRARRRKSKKQKGKKRKSRKQTGGRRTGGKKKGKRKTGKKRKRSTTSKAAPVNDIFS